MTYAMHLCLYEVGLAGRMKGGMVTVSESHAHLSPQSLEQKEPLLLLIIPSYCKRGMNNINMDTS